MGHTSTMNYNDKGPGSSSRYQDDAPSRPFGDHALTVDDQRNIVKKAYEQLKKSYEKLTKPTGDKDSPARTCKELSLARPELPTGDYWIDPNEGDKNDAILVHCDMSKKATCIKSQPQRSKNINHIGDDHEMWLSEVHDGMKLTYKADSSQLTHLQMLSTHASQSITYHCKNSIAYYDEEKKNYRRALKFLAWNDAELTAKNSQQLRYDVVSDGCQVNEFIEIIVLFRVFKKYFRFCSLLNRLAQVHGPKPKSIIRLSVQRGYQSWILLCETLAVPIKSLLLKSVRCAINHRTSLTTKRFTHLDVETSVPLAFVMF